MTPSGCLFWDCPDGEVERLFLHQEASTLRYRRVRPARAAASAAMTRIPSRVLPKTVSPNRRGEESVRIVHVVGARPNFMKAAPVSRTFAGRDGIQQTLVHTGQHYDANMSKVFFDELGMAPPDVNLEVASGSHGRQTGNVRIYTTSSVVDQDFSGVRKSRTADVIVHDYVWMGRTYLLIQV